MRIPSPIGALFLVVPFPLLGTMLAMWVVPGPIGKLAYFLCKAWILVLPLVWQIVVARKPLAWPSLGRRGLLPGAVSGAAIGACILIAGFFVLNRVDTAPLRQLAAENRFDAPAVYLAFAAYLVFVNSLLEEYVWRWFVLTHCRALMPAGAAVATAALLFTLHHVVALRSYLPWGATLLCAAGVFAGGALWGWLYQRYGSIWPGYLSHVLVDVAVLGVGWRLLFGP